MMGTFGRLTWRIPIERCSGLLSVLKVSIFLSVLIVCNLYAVLAYVKPLQVLVGLQAQLNQSAKTAYMQHDNS